MRRPIIAAVVALLALPAGALAAETTRGTTGADNLWRATVAVPAGSTQTVRAFIAGFTANGLRPGYTVAKKVTIK